MQKIIYPNSFPNPTEEEFLLLLLCPDHEFRSRWDRWRSMRDFERIEYAMLRLLPLLSIRLRNLSITDEPAGRIHGTYKLAWFKNQLLIDAMKKTAAKFEANDIPILLLKGVSLLLNVYKDEGARFLGDGDILIPTKDATKAMDLMLKQGWSYVNDFQDNFRKLGQSVVSRVLKETTFKNDKDVEIDIHWKLFDVDVDDWSYKKISQKQKYYSEMIEELWKRSVPIEFGSVPCRMLDPEGLFWHVVIHGAAGNLHRTLRWVVDAIHILRNQNINWQKLLATAKAFNNVYAMQVALQYLHNHFPQDVPESLLSLIMQEKVSKNEIDAYYKSADISVHFARFGNFPLLWYAYRDTKKEKGIDTGLPGFFEYLRIAYGLPSKHKIPKFILDKYILRISSKLKDKRGS